MLSCGQLLLALLAKGQKSLCHGHLSVVRASVNNFLLTRYSLHFWLYLNETYTVVRYPWELGSFLKSDLPMHDSIMALEIVKIAIIELVNTIEPSRSMPVEHRPSLASCHIYRVEKIVRILFIMFSKVIWCGCIKCYWYMRDKPRTLLYQIWN